MTMPQLDPFAWWIVAAAVLAIAEVVVPGVFLIWLAAAALLTGALTFLTSMPEALQFAIFAVAAVVAVYGGRRWLIAHPVTSTDPLLNDRAARLVGRVVLVDQAIQAGEGRVRVDDGVWTATGPDAPSGARVRILGADGSRLMVEPV